MNYLDVRDQQKWGGLEDLMDDADIENISKKTDEIADNIRRRTQNSYFDSSDVMTNKSYAKRVKKKINDFYTSNLHSKFPVSLQKTWDVMKDTWTQKYRKAFDHAKWKKSGAGKNLQASDIVLNDDQIDYTNRFLEVKRGGDGSTSPWVEATDTELINQGYKEGMIHQIKLF